MVTYKKDNTTIANFKIIHSSSMPPNTSSSKPQTSPQTGSQSVQTSNDPNKQKRFNDGMAKLKTMATPGAMKLDNVINKS